MHIEKRHFQKRRKFLMYGWMFTTLGGLESLLKVDNYLTIKERSQLEEARKILDAFSLNFKTNTKLLEAKLK